MPNQVFLTFRFSLTYVDFLINIKWSFQAVRDLCVFVLSNELICLWWLYSRNSLEISSQEITVIVHYLPEEGLVGPYCSSTRMDNMSALHQCDHDFSSSISWPSWLPTEAAEPSCHDQLKLFIAQEKTHVLVTHLFVAHCVVEVGYLFFNCFCLIHKGIKAHGEETTVGVVENNFWVQSIGASGPTLVFSCHLTSLASQAIQRTLT